MSALEGQERPVELGHGEDARERFLKPKWNLPSVRGLICLYNRAGDTLPLITVQRWVRAHRNLYTTPKVDLLALPEHLHFIEAVFEWCLSDEIRPSLRLKPVCAPPSALKSWTGRYGMPDLCLAPADPTDPLTWAWLDAAAEAGLLVRLWLEPAVMTGISAHTVEQLARRRDQFSTITAYLTDPFIPTDSPGGDWWPHWIANASALRDADLPLILRDVPFCALPESLWPHVQNDLQRRRDCRDYNAPSRALAEQLFRHSPGRIDAVLENMLSRGVSLHQGIDAALFPWLLDYPRAYIRVWMYHKLARRLSPLKRRFRPPPRTPEEWDRALEQYERKRAADRGPVCGKCAMRMVCDRVTEAFSTACPDFTPRTISGTPCLWAGAFPDRETLLDPVDRQRLKTLEARDQLAETAREILRRQPPTRALSEQDYTVEGVYSLHMPGAVRWTSFSVCEQISTPLARLKPPFTVSYMLGGGVAEYAGFALGRHARLLVPMVDYTHRITLHVNRDGAFVLLRDDQSLLPVRLEGNRAVPERLPDLCEPRICLHNIDGMIFTQSVQVWEHTDTAPPAPGDLLFSVIVVCTRFSRRLQAALTSIGRQQGLPRRSVEVIVAYVPGIDAADDVLDSMEMLYPDTRWVRLPMPPGCVKAKGFMINEAARLASGKWTALMDADIVAPPDLLARIEALGPQAFHVAPEGRKMLDPKTTAAILTGAIRPWECHEQLLAGPGELRVRESDGTPIGFFQCVRREILQRVKYHELDHFESSDWHFGRDVTWKYGFETRLQGVYVLHLDHGGSQWYGAFRHR